MSFDSPQAISLACGFTRFNNNVHYSDESYKENKVMKCTVNDINLSFDRDNRLRKTILNVVGYDMKKAYVLASFLNNNDFKKYLLSNLREEDILKGETVNKDSFTVDDYVKIKQNKLGSLLNVYYLDHYFSVNNSKTNKALGRLNGFSSGSAKTIAKTYCASLIIDEYYKEYGKARNVRRSLREIIRDVNEELLKTFYNRVDSFAQLVLNNDNYSADAQRYAQSYLDVLRRIQEIKDRNNENKSQIDKINEEKNRIAAENNSKIAEYNKAVKAKDTAKAVKLKAELEATKRQINELVNQGKDIQKKIEDRIDSSRYLTVDKYAIAQNLINLYTSNVDNNLKVTLRNFANLVAQSRGDSSGWYFQVFNNKRLTSVIKDFEQIGDLDEFLSEVDIATGEFLNGSNRDTIDETAKSWEDNGYNSFSQSISNDVRLILSAIPKLDKRYNSKDNVQSLDTNNELGVPTYMDAQFVTVQLYSFGDFSSVESMINSLDNATRNIKSIYGIGMLVDRMKKNPVLANRIFANFSKPIMPKTILTIRDAARDTGINFDISNTSSDTKTNLIFSLSNKLRATYNTSYDANDINKLRDIIKNYRKDKNRRNVQKDLFDIVSKYFPNFNKEIFDNYFDNIAGRRNIDIEGLISNMASVIQGIGKLKTDINNTIARYDAYNQEQWNNYRKDLAVYNELTEEEKANKEKPELPERRYIDLSQFDLNQDIYSGIINFVDKIGDYVESRAQLNSTNAAGNSSSSVGKNSYITRFFEQIQYGTEEDSMAGLKALRDYVTQGAKHPEKGEFNQYSNNPLFFGLKDENGKVIVPGLFIPTATGYDINPNAKEILNYSLFDGTKNTQDNTGGTYSSLSKLDFFITQYFAFRDSYNTISNDKRTKTIGNLDSSVYAMRIGSDAPKIFFVRAPRYNRNQVQYAFYNHLMSEINLLLKGLDNVFTNESGIWKTRTDVHGLIGRALFNERASGKVKNGNYTSAIVNGDRLAGNVFSFKRLFPTSTYNPSADIEQTIFLYGGSPTDRLISRGSDGRLILTPNSTISHNGTHFVINLSQEQKTALKDIVRKWTNAYLADAMARTKPYVDVMNANNIKYNQDIHELYLLNEANMNMNYDDLFEGDYKFYNNARDFLKRTKETQAGGDGYAGYDISRNDTTVHDLGTTRNPEYITIESTRQKNEDGTPKRITLGETPMIARNGWKGLTIYNTNKPSDYAPQMQAELEKILIKQGMSPKLAKQRSTQIASGFGFSAADYSGATTKINDAQSYITLEEFIRRRYADGTIQQYADLLEQLMDENTNGYDIDLSEINARIQVQKNFYFDKVFDSETGIFMPRQIKNAEFVLIPKLLPEGSELRKVYDFMKKFGIGQLNTAETSKAAKKGIYTIWDAETGEMTEEFKSLFNEDGSIKEDAQFDNTLAEDYFYQYLYKQQDVPQHLVDAHNKAGIQITKKVIDNLINRTEKDSPERKRLEQLAEEYQTAYSANINEDFHKFLDMMGWEVDIEGRITNLNYATTDMNGAPLPADVIKTNKETLNFNKFYARAREEAARLGMDSNFIEYLMPNEFGVPTMPNWMNTVSTKLESIMQALYNSNITRQTLPGWHAAQITGVGYSKKLKFDAATGVMEVMLPRWSNLIPKGKNAEEDAEILKQIQEEGLDIHVGYRIPTEGKQSVAVLRVVGFVNDCLGSTIVVPDEWVTQTGSDFDVDSVYGICWEMYKKKDKKGKVTLHKVPYTVETTNVEDLYIRYVQKKLTDRIERDDVGEEIEDEIKTLRERLNGTSQRNALEVEFKKIDEMRNDLYTKLPRRIQNVIINENKAATKKAKKDKVVVDLIALYDAIIDKFNTNINKGSYNEKELPLVEEYMDYLTGLIDVMNRQEGIPAFDKEAYRTGKAELIQGIVADAKQEYLKKVEKAAKDIGLESFKEFNERPFIEKLDRRARNNYILDRIYQILSSENSREEQYARSNFDDIINGKNGANDIVDALYGKSMQKTSPYNPVDQLDYFEDVMGGARLKAISVNWDNFVSKCNVMQPLLSEQDAVLVDMVVDEKQDEASNVVYNLESLVKSYDKDVTKDSSTGRGEQTNTAGTADAAIIADIKENIGIGNAKTTIDTLNSDNNELSDDEKDYVSKHLGSKPRVLIASEATDPVFHAAKIKALVERELAKPITERQFHMMYIITKHDGLPFRELAELKIPKFVHFSVTSLGGTKYEPGTMKMDDLLDRIETFINEKVLNPALVTIRIDPIIPGVTNKDDIAHIIERGKTMGIRQFKFSLMDSYGYSEDTKASRFVVSSMKKLGYDWDKYYNFTNGKYLFNPKPEYIREYYAYMDSLAEQYNVHIWTCGEQPKGLNLNRVRTNVGCVNVDAMNKATGMTDIVNVEGHQRKECSCYGNKSDCLTYNDHCASSCMYCYAGHSKNTHVKYYNEDGTLKDNDFTRTVKRVKDTTQDTGNLSSNNSNKNTVRFKARRIGWSNDNKNTVGSFVTLYSAETTAHHLDAVKMGSIPNVDEYTFNVYKFLSTLGIDFETIIGFIRQPAITRLVAYNNLVNSVFVSDTSNPINLTIQAIARDMQFKINNKSINSFTKIDDVISVLKGNTMFAGAFEDLFGIDISKMNNQDILDLNLALNKKQLFDRIRNYANGQGDIYINAAFDLGMTILFKRYKNLTNKLSDYIRVTNADKFGADNTIRGTREIVRTVDLLRDDQTLVVGGTTFINAIYPYRGIYTAGYADSEYKPVATVYARATIPSVQTNTKLFVTENDDFANALDNVQSAIKHRLNESEYKEYKHYAIATLYNSIDTLLSPLTLDVRGRVIVNTSAVNESLTSENESYWNSERSRIYGYGITIDGDFVIDNINEPTEEDINKFNKLTPAQKVLFIQKYFPDNQGIANYIKVTLLNNTDASHRGLSRQYLAYDDQVDDIEDLYQLFENSFSNHNPLIRLMTIDLIKYAFIAEGFNFRSGYISKIIPNDTLYSSIEDGGMNIIEKMKTAIKTLPREISSEEFINNYVRSHSTLIKVTRLPRLLKEQWNESAQAMSRPDNEGKSFLTHTAASGLVYFDATSDNKNVQGILRRVGNNTYIRVNHQRNNGNAVTILYKVEQRNPIVVDENVTGYRDVFLIPLNLLDSYETYDYSYNANYNSFNSYEDYLNEVDQMANIAEHNRQASSAVNKIKMQSVYKPVGKYVGPQNYNTSDKLLLLDIYNNGNAYVKAGVQKLINGINAYINNHEGLTGAYNQYNLNNQLAEIIPRGQYIEQIILDNEGNEVDITIAHYPMNDNRIKTFNAYRDGKKSNTEFDDVAKEMRNNRQIPTKNIEVYRVSLTKKSKEELDNTALQAATDLVTETPPASSAVDDLLVSPRRERIDAVSALMINEINYNARRYNNASAREFMNIITRRGVDRTMNRSISQHREDIYKNAARYYRIAANSIINKLNSFDVAGFVAPMDSPELYEQLTAHDEYFPEIAKIILDGITFGNRIKDILNLDISAEDEEVKDAVNSIIDSINSVRQNKILANAMNNLINIYFKKYSSNPEIMNDLMQLRETFGDTDVIEAWITDPTELANSEVQTILKHIYTMFSKAEMFDAERNVKEWEEALAAIDAMEGPLDINKVINFDNFSIKQGFTEDFYKERQRVIDELNVAKDKRFNSLADYKQYLQARFNRDYFFYKNTNQPIVDSYYEEDLRLREAAMRDAGNLYTEYMMLTAQLYDTNNGIEETDEERSNRKVRLKARIAELKRNVDIVGNEKNPDTLRKVMALNKYIEARRKLAEKYFSSQEYEGFAEDYKRYKSFVEKYDAKHADETLDEKLANANYNEAYNWLKNNGSVRFSKEESEKLRNAFNALTGRKTTISKKRLISLRKIEGAIDEAGIINPTVLTDEQIDTFKAEEEAELEKMYDGGYRESALIKDIPDNIPVMIVRPKKKEHSEYAEEGTYTNNARKAELIRAINTILSKTIDVNTGRIDIKAMFDNHYVTEEERRKLGQLYTELRSLRRPFKDKKKKNPVFTRETYNEGYLTAMNYYNTHLINTKQAKEFLDIFTELDSNGELAPNSLMFGYLTPSDEYIDTAKTNARKYINDNVEFVPSEYYYQAMNEAKANGTYDEWFKRNHVYNPYQHKYTPLKIWTRLEAKPGSKLAESVSYVPTFENMERKVKPEFINKNFTEYGSHYKRGGDFDTNETLNAKEQALRDLLVNTMDKYASTYQSKKFVGQGYLPRERKNEVSTQWMLTQAAALFGVSWRSGHDSDNFFKEVDYTHDREADMPMMDLVKTKGTREYERMPIKGTMSDEEYNKRVAEVRAKNEEIRKANEKLDSANINKDWREVMQHFVHNATIFNSRQAAKPYLYLLLEDLAVNNAYMIRGIWNRRLVKDYEGSTKDNTQYMTVKQERTRAVVHNLARRLLFEQYHENNVPRTIANFLQNLTSAKYMVMNLYGGVANVTTGKVNIAMEAFANEYFGHADYLAGEKEYLSHSVSFIADNYSDKANNLTSAIIKQYHVVDFDQVLQAGDTAKDLEGFMRNVRNYLYTFQSAGEHLMQNSVLLAMMRSNRIFTDANGNTVIGDFKDYTWKIEQLAMEDVIKNNPNIANLYRLYKESIKYDVAEKLDITTARKDFNRAFLRSLRNPNQEGSEELYRKTAEAYHKRRNEMLEEAKTRFYEAPTVYSAYEFKNGKAVVKSELDINNIETLLAGFRQKVISVNKKIHGVYDQEGAAMLESKWFGSIVMQYHKHLYTGIMKRWRRKGYYSEFRGSRERGSNQTLIDFLGTEFTNFKNDVRYKENNGSNVALASLQVVMKDVINTIMDMQFNWNNLSKWEQRNIKRTLGDLSGVLAAVLIVMALYGLWDDDDIRDDNFKASLLYLADRLYSDSSMYSPVGLISEYKTAWSSPIASATGPSDLVKAMTLIPKALFDPDYEPTYQSGQYAGHNKLEILIRRNIPGVRPYDRIDFITKNNQYYKVGDSQIGINAAKTFGELLHD